ncbi:MAG TPA: Rv1355c family protein [Polyangiaceae bacterium]|nr:Rv1355c family protein [Polyangiaceae bacterium]
MQQATLSLSSFRPNPATTLSLYRPQLLRPSDAGDRAVLEALRSERGVELHDTFREQVAGLLKSRRARRPPTEHELDVEIQRYAAGRPLAELGVWVHYPWRRSLVHLLDEAEFVELRTSRNRYKITGEEQAILARRKVGVVGLSVGGQVALTLAIERSCGELRLADFDALELSNLNRLREGVFSLGVKKTTLAARSIAEIDPFLHVVCYEDGLTAQNLESFLSAGGRLDVLVEECDGLAMKLECRERARELGIPVVMEANDRATLDIERFDREPTRPILHGLLEGLDLSRVSELKTNDEKVPYLLPMVGEATMSDKLRASLLEVGESIETWPQLASDVALGAGLVANVVRRISLGQLNDSGRYFVDLEELVRDRPASAPPESGAIPRAPALGMTSLGADERAPEPLPGQLMPSAAALTSLLDAAALAPSGGNEQPWRWLRARSELWLLPERAFGDSLLNHRDNASFLALGAAAENLVLRAHELGFAVELEPPSAQQPQPKCRFRFFPAGAAPRAEESHAWDSLAPFIAERHTNRRRGETTALASAVLAELAHPLAALPGLKLQVVTQRAAIAEVAEVAARADRIRMLHPEGHRDLVREIRWTKEEAVRERDGIDLSSMELTAAEHAGLRMLRFESVAELLRSWKRGRGLERLTRNAVLASSAVGLITAPGGSIEERFLAGRALERVWLTATRLGVSLQPHTASLFLFARALGGGGADFDADTIGELLGLQARLRGVFQPSGCELFLFRLFPASEPLARSLRRPVVLGERTFEG